MFAKAAVFLILVVLTGFIVPDPAPAQENPFQIAFIGPTMQLVDDDEDVRGIRLNILYGVNRNVSGLDLGLINHTNGEMTGVEFGIVNLVDDAFSGWQFGVVNVVQGSATGLQWSPSALANFAEAAEGAQVAWVFNRSEYMRGFQLSLVNVADDMYGLQVGLINVIRSKENFPILPIVNWKFDQ